MQKTFNRDRNLPVSTLV